MRDCDMLYLSLYSNYLLNMANKELNRLKVVLAEKKKTNKWLGEQLGKDKQPYQNGVPILANRTWATL